MPARMAMIAITTNSSMSVNAITGCEARSFLPSIFIAEGAVLGRTLAVHPIPARGFLNAQGGKGLQTTWTSGGESTQCVGPNPGKTTIPDEEPNRRTHASAGGRQAPEELETLGALPLGTPVGNGPRG